MKRILALMISMSFILLLSGCSPSTGEMTYTGTYVKTSQGQNVLIHTAENGKEHFLLQKAENCRDFDTLKTGSKITVYVPCLAYENEILTEMTVYKWKKKLFSHTDISQAVLDTIEELLQQRLGTISHSE